MSTRLLPETLSFTAFERVVVFFSRTMAIRFMTSHVMRTIAYDFLDKAGYAAGILTSTRAQNPHHQAVGGCPVFVLDATHFANIPPHELVERVIRMRENVMATIRGRIVVVFPPFWPDAPEQRETLDMIYVHQDDPAKLAKALGYGSVPQDLVHVMQGVCRLCCMALPTDANRIQTMDCADTHCVCKACFETCAPTCCPYPECLLHHVPFDDMGMGTLDIATQSPHGPAAQRTLSDFDIIMAFKESDDFWVDKELDALLQDVAHAATDNFNKTKMDAGPSHNKVAAEPAHKKHKASI